MTGRDYINRRRYILYKELEAYKDADDKTLVENELKELDALEKELKALEIIKKYFVFHHIGTDTGNKTFHIIATSEKLIPAEDYYLLKEELL